MSWCALDIRAPAESRDAVATWLVGRTGQAVEEHDDGLLTGFAESEAAAGTLRESLLDAFGATLAVATRSLPDIDWSERWRLGLAPRLIGRLVVTSSWTAPAGSPAPTVIIDPEAAFGTGEHGSTRTALALLDRYVSPGDRVLDLGSGSGILAIAAVKLGAARATGVELDVEVEATAIANAVRNGVAERVTFLTGDAALLCPLLGPAELILSNILRSVNVALLPVIRKSLTKGGTAIFAGMETPERAPFLAALSEAGLVPRQEAVDDAWWGVAVRGG